MPDPVTRTIEVFRPGTFTPMQGAPLTYSADDLRAIAAAYDPAVSEAPAVIGHPKTDDPAFGWAERFYYDDAANRLMAEVGQLHPQFAEAVANKSYKRVSLSFYRPDAPANPKPGSWYPKHIGFLGATAPAVTGLKPVAFAGDDTGVVEFASVARPTGSLFRSLRDFLIEKFSLDEADRVLLDYEIRWLDELGREEEAREELSSSAFSEPQPEKPMPNEKAAAEAAEREARLATREARLDEREQETIHSTNVSFAEALVTGGRILPVQRDRLVAALDAIDTDSPSVSFAEGDPEPAGMVLRSILNDLPPVVPYGQSQNESLDSHISDFAAPPGTTVDAADLELLKKAQGYQREHKVSLNEALKAVSR